ncbi:hypothetical protein D3C87_2039270 [compost metagenome]
MAIILSQRTDAVQATQLTSLLVSIVSCRFKEAHRHILVTSRLARKDLRMMRAVHWLECHFIVCFLASY